MQQSIFDQLNALQNYGTNMGAAPTVANAPQDYSSMSDYSQMFGLTNSQLSQPQGGWFENLQNFMGGGGNGQGSGFGSMQGWGTALGGIGSLIGAYNGIQQGKLAKEQFGVSKALANRNLSNQATVTNEALRAKQGGRNAVFGGNVKAPQVDGSAVG